MRPISPPTTPFGSPEGAVPGVGRDTARATVFECTFGLDPPITRRPEGRPTLAQRAGMRQYTAPAAVPGRRGRAPAPPPTGGGAPVRARRRVPGRLRPGHPSCSPGARQSGPTPSPAMPVPAAVAESAAARPGGTSTPARPTGTKMPRLRQLRSNSDLENRSATGNSAWDIPPERVPGSLRAFPARAVISEPAGSASGRTGEQCPAVRRPSLCEDCFEVILDRVL